MGYVPWSKSLVSSPTIHHLKDLLHQQHHYHKQSGEGELQSDGDKPTGIDHGSLPMWYSRGMHGDDPTPCMLVVESLSPLRAVVPGQVTGVYDVHGRICLGGGVICGTLNEHRHEEREGER